MFKTLYNWFAKKRSYPLSEVPPGFFSRPSEYTFGHRPHVVAADQAATLSPFFAALRLYQQSLSSLPLVAYQRDADGGRTRLRDKATFALLHERPNPAMSAAVFFERLVHDYFVYGEFFVRIGWAGNHRLLGLYPIHPSAIKSVELTDDWHKVYHLNNPDEAPLEDHEVMHVVRFSTDGFRGVPFLSYAATSLSLHAQILQTAEAIYRNSARISGQITQSVNIPKEARDQLKEQLGDFAGAINAGKMPMMPLGMKIEQVDTRSAEATMLIDALNLSAADIGRWFDNLSPLLIGDLSRGTYSNSAAEKLGFYQKNLLPLLRKVELEFNHKLFGNNEDRYAEFLTDNVLRADPLTQAQVWNLGLVGGYLLKSEIRQWLNLPPVEGMDVPTAPLNMGPVQQSPAAPDNPTEDAHDEPQTAQAI